MSWENLYFLLVLFFHLLTVFSSVKPLENRNFKPVMLNVLSNISVFAESLKLPFFNYKVHVLLHFHSVISFLDCPFSILLEKRLISNYFVVKCDFHKNIPFGLQGFSGYRRNTITSLINLSLKLLSYVMWIFPRVSRNRRATITSLINLLSKTTELSHFPVCYGAYMWKKMPGLMGYPEEWISCII